MPAAPASPTPLGHTFNAPIGVNIKGELWSCVEMPDSQEFFGTGKSVKVRGRIDAVEFAGAFMPTGTGAHMLSVSKVLRKKLGKDVGDTVTVHLDERLS